MVNVKFSKMWKVIRENNLQINKNVNSDFLCTICKNILIDARNSPCGCRFCKDCIEDYLEYDSQMCPGKFDYCKDELLNLGTNIHIDQAINVKVSMLRIKCPLMHCKAEIELISMKNHIKHCKKVKVHCPYYSFGCEENQLLHDDIEYHLSKQTYHHTEMLTNWIINSRNDVFKLFTKSEKLQQENIDLKEKIRIDDEKLKTIFKDIDELRTQLKVETSKLSDENRRLRHKFKSMKKKNRNSRLLLTNKIEFASQDIDGLFLRMDSLTNKIAMVSSNYSTISPIEDLISENDENNKCGIFLDSPDSYYGCQFNCMEIDKKEFIWKIDNWSQKRNCAQNGINENLNSKSFFTGDHGYKLYLQVSPDGINSGRGTHLSVYCCLQAGEYDDDLPWPFKQHLKLYLVNQESGINYERTVNCIKYDQISKPSTDFNLGFGFGKFIKLEDIDHDSPYCLNDQLIIKCVVGSCSNYDEL